MKIFLSILVLVTMLEFAVCFHYDNVLYTSQNGAATVSSDSSNNKKASQDAPKGEVLIANEKAKIVAISDNKQYVAYVGNGNKLHVVDLQQKQEVYSSTEKDELVYLKWIRNDSLFIGLKSRSHSLVLKTFQMGGNSTRLIKTFKDVSSVSTFQSIVYSAYTNDVYVLIGNDTDTVMYHFDTNGTMTPFELNKSYVLNPMMLSTKNDLFYEDKLRNIWLYHDGSFTNIRSNAILLSVVNDTMYYGILNENGKVISVAEYKDGTKQKLFDLETPALRKNILVEQDGNVLIANGNSYYDEKADKNKSLPSHSQLLSDNHSFFILTSGKTYLLADN